MIRKAINITKGFLYKWFKVNEDLHQKRMTICMNCPNLDIEGNTCVVKKTAPCCSLCGCSLEAKTRVKEEMCDNLKW